MWRTALLCATLLAGAWATAGWLTHNFQVWTAEGARRLEVARAPVATPATRIEHPDATRDELANLLANGRDVTIVEFIYTHCESVCLALGSIFQQMQATLRAAAPNDAAADRVRLLSITFDPERDTPPQLRRYAARMRAEAPVWRFVRVPEPTQLRRLLADFQVVVVPIEHGDFEHNAALLVVDPKGRLVRIFDAEQHRLALDYARHLAEGGTP